MFAEQLEIFGIAFFFFFSSTAIKSVEFRKLDLSASKKAAL